MTPTPHNHAKKGDIAETVLMPGDPLRAKFISERFLDDPVLFNNVRGMLGYTGTYRGKRVSVQGTGMGIPSISIYVNELFKDFGVKRAIRIGTAGSIQEKLKIRDIVIATAACTDSGANRIRFRGMDFAPTSTFALAKKAWETAEIKGWHTATGAVISSDMFYTEDPEEWKLWARYGVLAVEMESAELFTLAAKYGRECLALLTISDSLVTGETTSSEERQNTFTKMMEIALETAIS